MKYLLQIPNILNHFYKNNYCSDRPERRLFAPGSKYAEPLPVFFTSIFAVRLWSLLALFLLQ